MYWQCNNAASQSVHIKHVFGFFSFSKTHCTTHARAGTVVCFWLPADHAIALAQAGAPFTYLTPKSPFGPPGLWDAVRINPPRADRRRISAETAGVESKPLVPTMTCATPFAAAILKMVWIAGLHQ